MKLITYSDLHLEFGTAFRPPKKSAADLMILAGDVITFQDYSPLDRFLQGWRKPVLYVTGNHEYYNREPIQQGEARFKHWLAVYHPNVVCLQNEAVDINGVHFFGGTMWTDFNRADRYAMGIAWRHMNDYTCIRATEQKVLVPDDTVVFHDVFMKQLLAWLRKRLNGPRIVISHHAPVVNPHTAYGNNALSPAFNSLDMLAIIHRYQPRLWVYGHTHECDDQMVGTTQIISNQLGYPQQNGGFECRGFDRNGLMVEV